MNEPAYVEISLGDDIILQLTEHDGCSPGARAYIDDFEGLRAYYDLLMLKANEASHSNFMNNFHIRIRKLHCAILIRR